VQFECDNNLHFGNILNIILIRNNYFCLIEKFTSVLDETFIHTTNDEHLNDILKKNFKLFFDKIDYSQIENVLIDIDNIVTKCVYMAIPGSNKAWISPCVNLDDHD
jgi:hypothetical protein